MENVRKNRRGNILFLSAVLVIFGGFIAIGSSTAPAGQDGEIEEHKLDRELFRSWNKIRDEWIKHRYAGCLKKHRIRMNCSSCTHAYIKVALTIGGDGRLKGYRKIEENLCAGPAPEGLEDCFLEYFRDLEFPEVLRGKIFVTRLGTGLSC